MRWWRALFRALTVASVLLTLLALLQLGLHALGDPTLYRLGHASRALLLDGLHLYLGLPLAVAACAAYAGWRERSAWARSLVLGLACLAAVGLGDLQLRRREAHRYDTNFPRLGWWTGEAPPGTVRSWNGAERITPQGLRGVRPTPYRHAGRRILCLGDSFTWGQLVGEDECWPIRVADTLHVPVLNAGIPGYGVDQMATLYDERLADRFDHTEVVVGLILDDAYRATERFFFNKRKPFSPPGGELEPVPPLTSAYAPESQVLRPWLRSGRHLLRALGLLPGAEDHLADALRRIVARAAPRPVYVVLMSTSWDDGSYMPRFAQIAADCGVRASVKVDLSGTYLPDGHPDAEGHRRIGAAVSGMLR